MWIFPLTFNSKKSYINVHIKIKGKRNNKNAKLAKVIVRNKPKL